MHEGLPTHKKMITRGKALPVQIIDIRYNHTSQGVVHVQYWNKKERTIRAFKFFCICWGAAVFSILLPLLHFVLVPAFFIAGPVVLFKTLGQESMILGGEGTCPSCKAFLPLPRSALRFPISHLCILCQSGVRIEQVSEI